MYFVFVEGVRKGGLDVNGLLHRVVGIGDWIAIQNADDVRMGYVAHLSEGACVVMFMDNVTDQSLPETLLIHCSDLQSLGVRRWCLQLSDQEDSSR